MSEQAATAVDGGPSAGTLLRQARESAGLHIAALAVSLKVPVKKLEALEADRFDLLPDAVFARALASSVCRNLKVDPAPILARLPQTAAPRLAREDSAINEPFRAPGDGPGPTLWDQMSRPVVLAVLAFLLGALVLIFLPSVPREGPPAAGVAAPPVASADTASKNEPSAGAVFAAPAPSPVPVAMPGAATAMAPGATPGVSQPAVATAATLSMSVALSAPAAPATSASTADVPMTAGKGVVTFSTRGESWIEVIDAAGVVVLRKVLMPGETAGADGRPPLSVVVGRADATEVWVRGKVFNLAPLSKDNVARFEVK